MPGFVVEPFALSLVHYRHHEAIFCDLHDIVDKRLRKLAGKRTPYFARLTGFLEHLKREIPSSRFAGLQRKWLRPGALGSDEQMFKFFDVVFWSEGKFRIAELLGLDKAAPQGIVDIGSGAAHFPFVAKYFAHRVLATDLMPAPDEPVLAMYADFRELFAIPWIAHCTTIETPLPPLDGEWQLCTALLTKFHVHSDGLPWNAAEWRRFLAGVAARLSPASRRIYLQLNEAHITPEVWTLLEKLADSTNPTARHVNIGTKLAGLANTPISHDRIPNGRASNP